MDDDEDECDPDRAACAVRVGETPGQSGEDKEEREQVRESWVRAMV